MRRRTAGPEDQIQRAVFQHLKQRGAPDVFAFHVPNGGKRKPIEAAIFKGLGVVAGVPDVIAVRDGHVYGLELKSNDGKMTMAQVDAHAGLRIAGATVATTYGLDEALAKLEQWGLVRGCVSR